MIPSNFSFSRYRTITLEGAVDAKGPAQDEIWIVLSGKIAHVDGTETLIYVQRKGEPVTADNLETIIADIDSFDSDNYPIFTVAKTQAVAAVTTPVIAGIPQIIIVDNDHMIRSQGAVGLIVKIIVAVYTKTTSAYQQPQQRFTWWG